MRAALPIAILTLRAAWRKKAVVAAASVLLAIAIGFPFVVSGDSQMFSHSSISILYTLSICVFVLGTAMICLAADEVAGAVRDGTFKLLRTKPVSAFALWIGKWTGLTMLAACLLALAMVATILHVASSDHGLLARDANSRISPRLPSLEEQYARMVELNTAGRSLPAEELKLLKAEIRHKLPYLPLTIPPGGSSSWTFDLPRPLGDLGAMLSLKFDSSSFNTRVVCADVELHADGRGSFAATNLSGSAMTPMFFHFRAPPSVALQTLHLEISNVGETDISIMPRQDLAILLPTRPFAANCLTAYLVCLSTISLLIALALFFGTCFTRPVALFCTFGLACAVLVGAYAVSDPDLVDEEDAARLPLVEKVVLMESMGTARLLSTVAGPTLRTSPISQLSSNESVPCSDVCYALLANAFLMPLFFALLASWAIKGKEYP